MERIIDKLNKQLLNGECPKEMIYNGVQQYELNWEMVKYNTFHKDDKYIKGKLPLGVEKTEWFEPVIHLIQKELENIDPLEELLRLQNKTSE